MPVRKTAKKSKSTAVKKPDKVRSKALALVSAPKSDTTAKTKPVTKARAKPRTGVAGARKAARVVGKVMTSVNGSIHNEADLFSELGKLAEYIQDAKREIAALRPSEVKEHFLPSASDELDAIVGATADATNAIMDAVEIIEGVMEQVDSQQNDRLMTATTAIYEACTFQDITGQRITRVVKTLQDIELKVDGLLEAFDSDKRTLKKSRPTATAPGKKLAAKKEVTDEDLLNGPQDAGVARSQAEIDALLASFD